MNETKGTIRYQNRPKFTEEVILEELRAFKAKEIYQLKKKENGVLVNMPLYIVTFDTCNLPQEVTIGWTRCPVREYIPRPRRCYKCQGFGHGAKTCRSQKEICANCGKDAHGQPCLKPTICPNCGEKHTASSQQCFYYKLEQEALATQVKDQISYGEAKKIATARFIRPNKTFADVLKIQQTEPENDNKKANNQTGRAQSPPTQKKNRAKIKLF